MSSTREDPCEVDFDELIDDPEMTSVIMRVDGRQVLLPRSKIAEIDLAKKTITIPEWLAQARDLV